jgi:hypothetical protein
MPHIEELDPDTQAAAGTSTSITHIAPRIEEIRPNKYTGLSTLSEQLDETNWATWSKRLTSIFKVCRVYDYIKRTIPKPNRLVDPVSAQNWTANDEYAKHLILANVSSSQLHHIDQDQTATQVWHSLISLHQATGFRTALTYMRSFYRMTAADDVNIPEYITNMKTLVDQINAMKTPFKIDDLTYAGVLAQSLPAAWDPFIDSLFRPGMLTGDTSTADDHIKPKTANSSYIPLTVPQSFKGSVLQIISIGFGFDNYSQPRTPLTTSHLPPPNNHGIYGTAVSVI